MNWARSRFYVLAPRTAARFMPDGLASTRRETADEIRLLSGKRANILQCASNGSLATALIRLIPTWMAFAGAIEIS
jgi:hypothetical protein